MRKSNRKFLRKYTDEEIAASFIAAWNEGDPDDIKSVLYSMIKRFGATSMSDTTGIPRTTLYDMCKDGSNPTLMNLCKILEFVKLQQYVNCTKDS